MEDLKFDAGKVVEAIKKTGIFDVDFYLSSYPDVVDAGLDPVFHYVVAGEREGRRPFLLFDPIWYRTTYGLNPTATNLLIHYLALGDKKGYSPSLYFDSAFYRDKYSIKPEDICIFHFVRNHKINSVDPLPFFSTSDYVSLYPDVLKSTLAPFYHFLRFGIYEGRIPMKDFSWAYVRTAHGLEGDNLQVFSRFLAYAVQLNWKCHGILPVERIQEQIKLNQQQSSSYEGSPVTVDFFRTRDVNVFAFYLPQYHRDVNNDEWWGEGFTEWTNLARGVPRYEGHYQPRIPGALGFYDLSSPSMLAKQAALAKASGVTGFGIYYYDFGSKDVLRTPLNLLRQNPQIDIKYFLIWANETWSRRWDGSEAEVLISQEYPQDFHKKLAEDFAGYFEDPRYQRIDGRPLIVVYRPSHIPNAAKFLTNLRSELKKLGYDALIYIAQSFGALDPRPYGADGALEFPPHKLGNSAHLINGSKAVYNPSPELRIYSYDEFVDISLSDYPAEYRLIKTAFPSWDNDARKQGNSSIVDGSTPQKFERWVRRLVDREVEANPTSPMICINAWNEWGEGAYLEPDRHYGYAYINSLARALETEQQTASRHMALVGHDLFGGGAQRLLVELGELYAGLGFTVSFVIIKTTAASDALLTRYSSVGSIFTLDKIAAENGWEEFHQAVLSRGAPHYIFNTSVAAQWASSLPLIQTRPSILLVHELKGMLRLSCDAGQLRESIGYFDKVIFPSGIVRTQFEAFTGVSVELAHELPQGLYKAEREMRPEAGNLERFSHFVESGRSPMVVTGIGFGDLRKGFDLFVNTCVELDRRGVDVLFVWQGEIHIDLARWVVSDCEDLIARKRLLLVPQNENIGNVLEVTDVFFLASREDPYPTVALEALSLGVPVLAFKGTGGIADLIQSQPFLGLCSQTLSVNAASDTLLELSDPTSWNTATAREKRAEWTREHHSFEEYALELTRHLGVEPKVDVMVLSRNHQMFTEERLRSVYCQSGQARKVFFIDVASTDETLTVAANFSEQYGRALSIIRAGDNRGYLPSLWKRAVSLSQAPYVWLAEGDDSCSDDFLRASVQALDRDGNVGFVFSGVVRIGETGEQRSDSLHAYVTNTLGDAWGRGGVFDGREFLEGAAVANPITNLSGVLWRREALEQALEKFDQDSYQLAFAYDWYLYLATATLGWKVGYLPQALCFHRVYDKSFSGSLSLERHIQEINRVHKLFETLCPEGVKERAERQAKYLADLSSRLTAGSRKLRRRSSTTVAEK